MNPSDRPVQVVIVAYNRADDLNACLDALESGVEITVVDNSRSPAVRAVANAHSVTYVDPGANLGFGAGANVALRSHLSGLPCDVLLLNPDAILKPSAFRALTAYMRRPGNDRLASVSPRIRDFDGIGEQRVIWPFPTPGRAWADAFGLGRLPTRHSYVIGAVLMLRWEALLEVGLFDERFFLYAEETDWQRRAQALGWGSGVCLEATAAHIGAATSNDPERREVLFHSAHEIYIRKWYGRRGWVVYRVGACLGAATRAVVLRGERRREAARRTLLYLRGPKRQAALLRS